MAAKGYVYYNGVLAGVLMKESDGFRFVYDEKYRADPATPAISLSFPKSRAEFHSPYLFPFFFGLLAEGENKVIQCRILGIDEQDHFTRLLKTTRFDTIGGITVREVK